MSAQLELASPVMPISAVEYYTNHRNYGEPWVTSGINKQNMVTCMHPSCELRRQQRNKTQTPGGGQGVLTDRQIAEIVQTGYVPSSEEALDMDYRERNSSVLDVHVGCAYRRFQTGITREMHDPSLSTMRTYERWNEEIYHKDGITKGVMDEVMGASGILLGTLPEGEQSDDPVLLGKFAETYPGKNVHRMEQIDQPVGMYVVSHLGNVVQNQKHRKHQEAPMAYFDSLGHLININNSRGDDRTQRTALLMNGSSILRSAAARTYIARMAIDHHMDLLEVTRRGKEMRFDFVEL